MFFPEVWFGVIIGIRRFGLSFVSFTCVEKAWMDVETFCGTTTIIGSAGANVHTSDPGRAVPYSSP